MKSFLKIISVFIVLCFILVWPVRAAICEYYEYRAMQNLFSSKMNLEQAKSYHTKARFFAPSSYWQLYETNTLIHLYSMNQLSGERSYRDGLRSVAEGQKRNKVFYKFDYLNAQLHNQMYMHTKDVKFLKLMGGSLESALLKNPRHLSSRFLLAKYYDHIGRRKDALFLLRDGIRIVRISNIYDISYLHKTLELERDLNNKRKSPLIEKRIQRLEMIHYRSRG